MIVFSLDGELGKGQSLVAELQSLLSEDQVQLGQFECRHFLQ